MDTTKHGLGPNKLFFWSLLQVYNLKRELALTVEDLNPDDIRGRSETITLLEKDAKIYFDKMVEDGSFQILVDDITLL